MSEQQPKVFCGNAKMFTFKTDQTGVEIKVTIDELQRMFAAAEERGWVREYSARGMMQREVTLKAWPMREPTKYATHYVELAEPYRRESSDAEQGVTTTKEDDELPF